LKDLTIVARMDANMEHESKAREHRVAVDPIAPDDLQIVRLPLTPRKNGAGGVDITLRAGNGETEQVRHVLPIVPEDTSPRQPSEAQGASPLQFKITPLKECFADRPGIFLIHVLNTDRNPMPARRDLIVSYMTPGKPSAAVPTPNIPLGGEGFGGPEMQMKGMARRGAVVVSNNPLRQISLSVPALAPGEGRTFPVRITPRRIGELQIVISEPSTPKVPAPQHLGTARLQVKFDPKAPVEQLLPVRAGAGVLTRLPQKLADVPEVSLEDPHGKAPPADEGFEHVAHLIEKINHVNTTKTDAYMEALAGKRADVAGLPFTLGDACRLPAERGQHFQTELGMLRAAMTNPAALASGLPNPTGQPNGESATQARIAALVQVVGPEGAQMGQQMVKYLATLSHVDATRALARLAIFSEDDKVRNDAVVALAVRREKDVNDILLGGLNYPWPAVAQRAADAIVKLKRTDLMPQLVEVLDRPDPRAPQVREKDSKKSLVVRELVRVNHLRNCLLCHSPASPGAAAQMIPNVNVDGRVERAAIPHGGKGGLMAGGPLTAPVPIPGQQVPTPSPRGGYGQFAIPDLLVSFDVTYLRQDFSVKLQVANAQPWPAEQRFDFLVRTREITEKEAQTYRDLLRPTRDGDLSPYQQVALTSLRKLTGRDAEPTATAWRRVIAEGKAQE